MLDIGWTELLVIAVVAIIVVGPKDLPRMLRSLGQYAGKLRRTANEFRSQFDEALRDSEFDELKSSVEGVSNLNPLNDIRDAVTDSLDPLKKTAEDIKSGIERDDAKASDVKPDATDAPKQDTESWTDDAVEDIGDTAAVREPADQHTVSTDKPDTKPSTETSEAALPPVKSET